LTRCSGGSPPRPPSRGSSPSRGSDVRAGRQLEHRRDVGVCRVLGEDLDRRARMCSGGGRHGGGGGGDGDGETDDGQSAAEGGVGLGLIAQSASGPVRSLRVRGGGGSSKWLAHFALMGGGGGGGAFFFFGGEPGELLLLAALPHAQQTRRGLRVGATRGSSNAWDKGGTSLDQTCTLCVINPPHPRPHTRTSWMAPCMCLMDMAPTFCTIVARRCTIAGP